MGEIKVMSESLANKISAGEVVEKVANVVKELVENSIDAGSKNIKIELLLSGTKMIKVIDDGKGMDKEDALLAFSRHATSKIYKENDLFFISTLGFRGEALASIASVSNVSLWTCKEGIGTHIELKGGNIILNEKGNERKGTIIEVNNLFYNTPARLKFLKSLNTELSNTVMYLEKLSLSHPDISFTLLNDAKEIFKTTGSNDLLKTIHEIFGYNVSKNMHYIEGENFDYSVKGYISDINVNKSSRSFMITLVNGRVVQNALLNKTIKEAYHTFLAEPKFPVVVLNIETDPTLIDVNIHPTKQDIKFSKFEELQNLTFKLIRDKLNNTDNTFKAYSEEPIKLEIPVNENNFVEKEVIETKPEYKELVLDFEVNEPIKEYNKEEKHLFEVVGLTLGTYLVAQSEDIMYLLDIHAANERINYEIYLDALKKEETKSTDLLFPITIELTKNEAIIIKDNLEVLRSLNFDIEEFGINTYKVNSHPIWLKEGYEEESIRRIFDLLYEFNGNFDRVKFNERLAINLACKMSVKANTSISFEEEEKLINRLFECEFPYTCPHGRPTIIKYPKYELEKLFKRAD